MHIHVSLERFILASLAQTAMLASVTDSTSYENVSYVSM